MMIPPMFIVPIGAFVLLWMVEAFSRKFDKRLFIANCIVVFFALAACFLIIRSFGCFGNPEDLDKNTYYQIVASVKDDPTSVVLRSRYGGDLIPVKFAVPVNTSHPDGWYVLSNDNNLVWATDHP